MTWEELAAATLARQFPGDLRGGDEPAAVGDALRRIGPVQSQTARSPYLALAARLPGVTHEAISTAYEDALIVRGSSLRGTVHTSAPGDHPLLEVSTRLGQRSLWARALRLREATLEQVWSATEHYARDEWRTPDDLYARLWSWLDQHDPGHEARLDGAAGRYLGFGHGGLLRRPLRGGWDGQGAPGYRAARAVLGDAEVRDAWLGDPEGALIALVRRHLACHGPAGRRDLAWWSGVGLRAVDAALGAIPELVTSVAPDGQDVHDLPGMPSGTGTHPAQVVPGVRLLPEFDALLCAYDPPARARFVDPEHYDVLWSQANGLLLAPLMVDGRLTGHWRAEGSGPRRRMRRHVVRPDPSPPEARGGGADGARCRGLPGRLERAADHAGLSPKGAGRLSGTFFRPARARVLRASGRLSGTFFRPARARVLRAFVLPDLGGANHVGGSVSAQVSARVQGYVSASWLSDGMAFRSSWMHPQEEVLRADLGAFVPDPLTPEEVADIAAVFEQQWAGLGPEHDPGSAEYWEALEERAVSMADVEPAGLPAQELAGGLSTAARGLGRAALSAAELTRVQDADLVAALEAVGRVRSQADAAGFDLALHAATRGLHTEVGLSLPDWLKVRCPWLSGAEAHQVTALVAAAQTHWGAPLAAAVRAGNAGIHRAAKVARTITRLARSLDPDQQQAYAAIATDAATNPGISDADLGKVCKKLLIDLLEDKPKDDAARTAYEQRCLTRRPLGGGMVRYTLDAPEEDAVLIDGILAGPLTRPTPGEDGTPDERSAGQRGYDAFQLVLNRGLANPGAPPSTGRASVMLTLRADPATGAPTGAAFTSTGAVLDAATAGKFACLGDVTPIVLGPYGEPLDLGRTQRLATPGQFKALMVRDGRCTYPGCSVPGTWCDAHHLIWWCRNGTTDIAVLVLLCPRHHTLVHAKDLMATVSGSTVTWDI